jgi:TldD protein
MLDDEDIEMILCAALRTGPDWAEVFAETRCTVRITSVGRRLEPIIASTDRGVGIRVVRDGRYSYAYTNTLTRESMLSAAAAAASAAPARAPAAPAAAASAGTGEPGGAGGVATPATHRVRAAGYREPPMADQIALVRRAEDAAWQQGAAVRQVTVSHLGQYQETVVVSSLGPLARHHGNRTRMLAQAVAARDGIVQRGLASRGARLGTEFYADVTPESIGAEAACQALRLLDADRIAGGEMAVVLGAGSGGVLLHEACGHGLEADAIARGRSVFAATQGRHIGSGLFSAVDDATLPGAWGSAAWDDEGTSAERTVLFDQGRQVGLLTDRLSAGHGSLRLTGNGRRQSYAHAPQPRMTNTLILPGPDDPRAVLEDVPHGLYAVGLSGGEVDPVTGEFLFGVTEGYLIENGRLTRRVRGATLIGNGPETLGCIDAVCTDTEMRQGMCGKSGQWVATAFGSPTLRLRRITVGGAAG